jgi:hypothetical protein
MFNKDEITILRDKEFTLRIKVTADGQINVLVESPPGSQSPLVGADCQKLENYLVRKFGVTLKVIPTHELYMQSEAAQEIEPEDRVKQAPPPIKEQPKQKPKDRLQGFQRNPLEDYLESLRAHVKRYPRDMEAKQELQMILKRRKHG